MSDKGNLDALVFGREVLAIEAEAVSKLADRLDEKFAAAVELVLGCTGKLVVTGIGKSGAIGRKLASTFSSTGTPSIFLHPAEGVHGDLGVLSGQDVLVLLSYSGETDELISIMPVVARIGAKVISMLGNGRSSIARYSDVVLDISVEKEACPLGLAPTASTIAMLAMGDALALAVMRARRFTREDFALFHPAGTLGRRLLLKVSDVMRTGDSVAIVGPELPLRDALFAITRAAAGAACVVDAKGGLLGIITDGDVRRHLLEDESCLSWPAQRVMTRNPKTIAPDRTAEEGLRIMEDLRIGEMPVLDDVRIVGMLMLKDLLKARIV